MNFGEWAMMPCGLVVVIAVVVVIARLLAHGHDDRR
jgi:hypothetical protein